MLTDKAESFKSGEGDFDISQTKNPPELDNLERISREGVFELREVAFVFDEDVDVADKRGRVSGSMDGEICMLELACQ